MTDGGGNVKNAMFDLVNKKTTNENDTASSDSTENESSDKEGPLMLTDGDSCDKIFPESIGVQNMTEKWGITSVKSQHVCVAHTLQLIPKDFLHKKKGSIIASDEVEYIKKVVANIRAVHVNGRAMEVLCSKTLQRHCITRWNTVSITMETLMEVSSRNYNIVSILVYSKLLFVKVI